MNDLSVGGIFWKLTVFCLVIAVQAVLFLAVITVCEKFWHPGTLFAVSVIAFIIALCSVDISFLCFAKGKETPFGFPFLMFDVFCFLTHIFFLVLSGYTW